MNEAHITVTVKSPGGVSYSGSVLLVPSPITVLAPDDNTVYIGPVRMELDENGFAEADVLTSDGWTYSVIFNLRTPGGAVECRTLGPVTITDDADLSDLLAVSVAGGISRPVIQFASYLPGEVRAIGVTMDPEDDGAVLLPAAVV